MCKKIDGLFLKIYNQYSFSYNNWNFCANWLSYKRSYKRKHKGIFFSQHSIDPREGEILRAKRGQPRTCPAMSGGRWTPTRWLHSSTPLWIHASITATLFLLVHQGQLWTSYSVHVERGCARRHRQSEVWPRPGSDTARRASLAWRPWSGVLQAGSDSSPVSERPRSTVPVGLLCRGRRCWHSATAAFQQPSTSCSTTLPAQYLRLPGREHCCMGTGTTVISR